MSKTSRKTGFTLVELLVVIAIIGILIGLLVPAIGAVQRTVAEFAINNDVELLERALENFRSEYGFYPPDMTQINSAEEFKPFLNQISRNHQESDADLEVWWREVGQNLNPENALVFWLTGIASNAQRPLTVASGRGRAGLPAYAVGNVERRDFIDLRSDQLEITGNVASYVQRRGARRTPYIYFNANSYAFNISNAGGHTVDGDRVRPYHNASENTFPDLADDTFQIIASGVDGQYGTTGDVNNLVTDDNDNVCSFSDGRLQKVIN